MGLSPVFVQMVEQFRKLVDEPSSTGPQAIKWVSAPHGYACRRCSSLHMVRSIHLIGGPYAGYVKCLDCEWMESVYAYAKKFSMAEPMKPCGSDIIYEPESEDAYE